MSDLAEQGLRGRVRTVTEIQFCEGKNKACTRTIDKYDTSGNLVEEVHNDYMLGLNTRKYARYEAAQNGLLVKRSEYDDSGIAIRTVEYKYDSTGRLAEMTDRRNFGSGGTVYRSEFFYDSTGAKVREKSYVNNAADYTTDYSYDGRRRIVVVKSADDRGRVTLREDYNYLASGTQWAHCEKQADSIRTHIFRALDTAGVVVERTTYTGDYSKNTTETYSNFDSHGNWLNATMRGMESYFTRRTIEYYK